MTGYATHTIVLARGTTSSTVTVNLKALNSKFFEATLKLPSAILSYETELFKLLKERLVRGTIFCVVQFSNPALFQERISPSKGTVTAYARALQEMIDELNLPTTLQLDHFLRLPNIFIFEESHLSDTEKKILFDAILHTIELLSHERKKEGESLARDCKTRLTTTLRELSAIEPLFKARLEAQKQTVHDTLEALKADSSTLGDAQRTALYTVLDRGDVQEEITRFKVHAASLEQCITSAKEVEKGKKLDFLLQELMRETNTLIAKCADSEISSRAISIKVEIEKIREQAQNIV
jgi:uncharacterized protein (TIGR00255 family)